MTEQPDTAELRALITKNGPPLSPMLIFTLLDALDGARAERDDEKHACLRSHARDAERLVTLRDEKRMLAARAEAVEARFLVACAESREYCERADNAESERDDCRATLALVAITREKRAEAAEARIAAALAVMDADPHDVDLEVRRALTEGTGQ